MQTLTVDPPVPFVLPPDRPIQIVLVGCGGTGSHILQSLARLSAHAPGSMGIVAIDGDTVERKNVGRQLFCEADVGLNKAQVLAARFSAVFGLRIAAVPQFADRKMLGDLRHNGAIIILVGAVDTPAARREIAAALGSWGTQIWLDCGNEEHAGQVVVGTTANADGLAGCLSLGGICSGLPAPSLVYPGLIEQTARPVGDCAAQVEQNIQGLMVNQGIAAVAAQYLYELVVERRITTFETSITLRGLAMRSTPITATNISKATGVPVAMLTKQPKKGKAA